MDFSRTQLLLEHFPLSWIVIIKRCHNVVSKQEIIEDHFVGLCIWLRVPGNTVLCPQVGGVTLLLSPVVLWEMEGNKATWLLDAIVCVRVFVKSWKPSKSAWRNNQSIRKEPEKSIKSPTILTTEWSRDASTSKNITSLLVALRF